MTKIIIRYKDPIKRKAPSFEAKVYRDGNEVVIELGIIKFRKPTVKSAVNEFSGLDIISARLIVAGQASANIDPTLESIIETGSEHL